MARSAGTAVVFAVCVGAAVDSGTIASAGWFTMGCFKPSKEDEDEKARREANRKIEKQLQKDKQAYRATHRLLLLGQ